MASELYKTWMDDSQCRYFAKLVWEHAHLHPEDRKVAIRILISLINRRNLEATVRDIEKAFTYFKKEVIDAMAQRGRKKAYTKSAKRVGLAPVGPRSQQRT